MGPLLIQYMSSFHDDLGRNMKQNRFHLIAIAFIAGLQCVGGQDVRSERSNISQLNWNNFLKYFEPALKSAGGVGRLYYRGDCWTERGDGILFPRLDLEALVESKSGIAAIQDLFKNTKQVTATRDPSGISRTSIGNVSYELLNTNISVLKFTPSEQYNEDQAVLAIERTKEVQSKMRDLKLQYPPTVFFGRVLDPANELPHLPVSLKNVTMDEALDRVAQTFGGLVKYGECASEGGTHLIFIDFEYIR